MKCWSCGTDNKDPDWGKLPFRASCETCSADLHCCRNCAFYKPGQPNDCAVKGTNFISDRTKNNLCEEFKLLKKDSSSLSGDPLQAAKRLFGEDSTQPQEKDSKKRFNSLFVEDTPDV